MPDQSVVKLTRLPMAILVRFGRTRASQLPGLDENVLPIIPTKQTMQIKMTSGTGTRMKTISRTVHRRQFAMTAAYAFTDYRSQGQTIPMVLVDIATPPPPGKLTLFNLYVALSRSSGRNTIRLLRDFDDAVFMQSHDADLLEEDDRLERLNEQTKKWWEEMGQRSGAQ